MKSLPPNKILLDSNAYFRLADNLYPLLSSVFGSSEKYKLSILGGTIKEYQYQARLQTKFNWVNSPRHFEDRKNGTLQLPKEIFQSIKDSMNFLLAESIDKELSCSRFDIECLSTVIELEIPLVTDDKDLIILAGEYNVQCFTTLKLLKIMLDSERVTMKEIQETVYMWDYMGDFPRNFFSDFLSLFNCKPERYD